MKKLIIAMAVVALASLTPGVAFASNAASSHGGGDGNDMDMDEHGSGGGDGHENARTVKGAHKIKVTAGGFRYDPKDITIEADEDVTIVMKSTDTFHDFFVKGTGHIVGAERKKTRKGGLNLDEPGTYKYWCTVPGHKSAGMKGTITVE